MIFLKKRWENTYLPVKALKGVYSEEINGEQTLEVTLLQSAKKHDTILFRLYDGRWIETIVHGATEYRNGTEVYAEHAAYELKQTFIKDKRPNNSPAEQLEMLLEGTRWTVGDVEMGGKYSNSYYYISVYDALKNLASSIGCELRFDIIFNGSEITARKVSLVRVLGEDRQRIFSYTKDLLGVTRTIKDDAVTTALIGRGRGEQISENGYGRRLDLSGIDKPDSPSGEIYVEDVNAKNLWGIAMSDGSIAHRMSKIEWDDIEDVETLYERTKQALQDMNEPKFTYKVDVVQLEGDDNLVTLGDPVRIIDQEFLDSEIVLHGRILRLETDILEHTNSRITIGNLGSDMASYYKHMEEDIAKFRSKSAIWDRSNAFDPNNRLPASYISGMLDKWNEEANLSGGYTYTIAGEGTVTYNKPIDENPTQVVQIVGGTIRIADSKKLDGSWDWRTVLNASGIAGEEILAQSITANQLRSDAGSNLDLSSNESIKLTIDGSLEEIDDKISEIDVDLSSIRLEVSQLGGYNIISNPIGRFGTLDWTFESSHIKAYTNAPFNKAYAKAPYLKAQNDNGSIMIGTPTDTQAKYGFRVWKAGKALSKIVKAEGGSDYSLHTKVKGTGVLRFKLREYTSALETNKSNFIKETLLGTTNPTTSYSTYEKTVTLGSTTQSVVLVVESDASSRNGRFALFTNTSFNIGQPKPYGESITDINNRIDSTEARVEIAEDTVNLFTSKVNTVEGRVDSNTAQLQVQAGEISSKVSTNGVISAINQTAESVKINANRINLTGYVTVASLSGQGTTTIDGSNIKTGTISASRINFNGATGTNVNLSGTITATSGKFGGWNIAYDYFDYRPNSTNNNNRMYFSAQSTDPYRIAAYNSSGRRVFSVSGEGVLNATGADITGKITATSGKIGDWNIGGSIRSAGTWNSPNHIFLDPRSDAAWRIYVSNSSGNRAFSVDPNGALRAIDADITGKITATSGTFTGTVSGSSITGGSINIGSGNFTVNSSGAVVAKSITTTGTHNGRVNATSGSFTGGSTATFSTGNFGGGYHNNGSFSYGAFGGTANISSGSLAGNSLTRNASGYTYISGTLGANMLYGANEVRTIKVDAVHVNYQYLNNTSDIRKKSDFKDIHEEFNNFIYALPIGTYYFTDDESKKAQIGINANFVDKMLPEEFTQYLISVDEAGYYSANYTALAPMLVKVVQSQNSRLIDLEWKIKELERKLNGRI